MKKSLYLYIIAAFLIIYSCGNSFSEKTDGDKSIASNSDENENSEIITSDETLSPEDYVKWIQNPENGFKKEKTIDDLIFSVQYKPVEYVVCMEERKSEIADSVLKKKMAELSDMQYFDLKIILKEEQGELLKYQLSSQQQYDNRVKYFSFEMQQDIKLIEGKDTIPCSLFHFERAYDITPFSTFLLGFDKNNKTSNEDKTLVLYDKTFNKGMVKLTFQQKYLKNIPKVKTI